MKKVHSLKTVTFKTGEKTYQSDYTPTFIYTEKPPTKEEKVVPFGKTERFSPLKSQNTLDYLK
jgi:hypothetical protein